MVVGGSGWRWRRNASASVRSSISESSSECSSSEVYWGSDSWSDVTGDESMLGVGAAL